MEKFLTSSSRFGSCQVLGSLEMLIPPWLCLQVWVCREWPFPSSPHWAGELHIPPAFKVLLQELSRSQALVPISTDILLSTSDVNLGSSCSSLTYLGTKELSGGSEGMVVCGPEARALPDWICSHVICTCPGLSKHTPSLPSLARSRWI